MSSKIIPIIALIGAMVSVQSGASLAKQLFPLIGPQGATALRIFYAALILLVVMRPWRELRASKRWGTLIGYGVALGCMNLLFYTSLKTLSLGVAVAIEFMGPLTVAVIFSRKALDFLWVGLAVFGLCLLLPIGNTRGVDLVGACFALGAGVCWALYIVIGQKAGAVHGKYTVSWGTLIASFVAVPVGLMEAGTAVFSLAVLPLGLGVAVLSSVLPYSLDMYALGKLPAKTFGTLMSMGPMVAALSGLVFLGEKLNGVEWLAIAAIITASIGCTLAVSSEPRPDSSVNA